MVNITNVNDNDPSFGNIVFTISEDVNNGDTVGVHTATDSDGNTITYEIQTQDVTGMFSYDSNGTVIIADNSQIDFDTDARHDMNVLAISEGDTVAAIITVLLTDVNDNLPILVGDTIEVSEEVSIDFVLFNLMGTDQDRDDIFTYEIESGNTNSDFKLVNDSELSVGNDLVYTRDSIYDLTVLGITNSDTARAQFVIKVIDVNVRPVITVDSLFIEENTLSGDLVSGTLIGVDEDSTQVIWSLEDTTLFVIDSLTGQISVRVDSTLNFETQGTVPVTIVASDDSSSAVRTVFITLINVNDAPVIQSSTLTVEENTSSGTIIGRVDAEDEDFDAVLTYEIVGGEIFTIDSTTGDIILREGESIDFEDQESYTFEVIVSDGEYSDTTEITIDIENIVETATISVVEIFDDSGRSVENTQEFYTSHDSVTIVYNKDGVLDSIRYSVDEGINLSLIHI